MSETTIKVGIISFDWETLADFGVNFGRVNAEDLYLTAIEEVNDRGGVHGRLLEPISCVFLPVGPTDGDRVCLELTEDNEVFVVIGTTLNDQILCFTEQHKTAADVASGMTPSTIERADAPYAAIIDSVDRRTNSFLTIMTDHGVLDDATVGVLGAVDVSPESYHTMFAALTDAKFDPVAGLIGGNAEDLEASAREQEVIAELMREAGVNVSVSTSGVPLVMANMRSAGYETDQWLLSALMTGRGLTEEGIPFDYLDGALGVSNTLLGSSEQPTLGDDPLVARSVDDLVE